MSPIDALPETLAWPEVATWLFCIGWSFIGAYVAKSLNKLSDTATKLESSINHLNTNVAVIVEKVNGHERRIERLEGQE